MYKIDISQTLQRYKNILRKSFNSLAGKINFKYYNITFTNKKNKKIVILLYKKKIKIYNNLII